MGRRHCPLPRYETSRPQTATVRCATVIFPTAKRSTAGAAVVFVVGELIACARSTAVCFHRTEPLRYPSTLNGIFSLEQALLEYFERRTFSLVGKHSVVGIFRRFHGIFLRKLRNIPHANYSSAHLECSEYSKGNPSTRFRYTMRFTTTLFFAMMPALLQLLAVAYAGGVQGDFVKCCACTRASE